MGEFTSRGRVHHADSTATCPGCGRRFRTHTVVAERPDGRVAVSFKSKQTGQWGFIEVPAGAVVWTDRFSPPPGWK
jgi:hypothetical protein